MRHVRTIATAIGVFMTFALLAMWWRSYSTADRVEGWLWDGDAMFVSSKQGCVGTMKFLWPGKPDEWGWRVRSLPVDDIKSIPPLEVSDSTNRVGFGRLDFLYYIISWPIEYSNGVVVSGHAYSLQGRGFIAPYWLLTLLSTLALALTRWCGRFSVRGMLIATAVTAVLIVVLKMWVFGDSDQVVAP